MPEYLAPGVYVEETSFRSKSIEGVSTTTTGFVGPGRYGPIDYESEILTSLADFERTYGDRLQLVYSGPPGIPNYLWHAVRSFFEEGGKRLYVARIFRQLVASGEPLPYERPTGKITEDKGSNADKDANGNFFDGHARNLLTKSGSTALDDSVLIRARFPGAYGNMRVRITVQLGKSVLGGTTAGQLTANSLRDYDTVWIQDIVSPISSPLASGNLYVARFDETERTWIFSQTNTPGASDFRLNSSTATNVLASGDLIRPVSLTVTVISPDGTSTSVWNNVPLNPNHKSAFGNADSLKDLFAQEPSSLAQARTLPIVILAGDNIDTGRDLLQALAGADFNTLLTAVGNPDSTDTARTIDKLLVGGNDGQLPEPTDYIGREDPDTNNKTGLVVFEDIDDISIVAAPGATASYNERETDATAIINALITHAQRMRYRIAVLDSGEGLSISEVRSQRAKMDSSYAALYYPWIRVLDPVTNTEMNLPPSGFVAGIYARNDINRAVYKAPANEVVNGAIGFEKFLNKAQQEVLNPEGINCFRFFEGRGFRLWGARTTSSDPEWKYVNLRRYFAYLEHSIDKGTQWAVFEPNGDLLWANVRRTIEDFLLNEWQNGALLGDKPEKAYFVKCDRSTMSQNDLDNGRLVCLIGVAPLRPAEFVIFRIGQWTADRKI
ncbi:MAG TPA: phage tail sheath subtilisin-like domain-containing protein [Pyrinomonadaceae bacterium]|nr:phage tail sheath subtilisin-like domain-containing protein [Pyrinomonadaceae bacterium]